LSDPNWPVNLLLDVGARTTLILILAYAAHALLGRRRALARTALWNASMAGLMILPLAAMAFPRLSIAILPAHATIKHAEKTSGTISAMTEPRAQDSKSAIMPESLAPANAAGPLETAQPSTEHSVRGGFGVTFLGAYVIVAGFLTLRFVGSLVGVWRLKTQCLPINDPSWARVMRQVRDRFGIARPVALLRSDRTSVPMVIGWLNPAIIVPAALASGALPALIEMVLLHELAHIRRGDYGWNLVYRLVRLAYWPHPLVWPLGRIVGSVREQACDDLCVHLLGGSARYRASLIEVASGLVLRPDSSMGMALARPSNLGRRLAWIDRSEGSDRCRLRTPARLAISLTMAAVASMIGSMELDRSRALAQPDAQTQQFDTPRTEPQPSSIDIVVVAKDTGRPLAGASVRAAIDFETSIRKTDNDGRARIDLSARKFKNSLGLDVWTDNYVQQRHYFAQNDARYPDVPDRFTVELLRADETLGGTVTDSNGQPISNVKVAVWGHLGEQKDAREAAWMVETSTDADGRWRLRCFRSMKSVYLYLTHPNYLSDDWFHPRRHGWSNPEIPPQPGDQPLARLRDFADLQTMTVGVPIAGRITDRLSKPVAGAVVGWVDAEPWNTAVSSIPTTSTDSEGRFRFSHARPGRLLLLAKAKGRAPALNGIDAKEGSAPVAIRLGLPSTVSGRVLDSEGKPIPDAVVNIAIWRDSQAFGEYLKTDADGRFRWEDAPPEPVRIHVTHPGYSTGRAQRVATDGREATFTLNRSQPTSVHPSGSPKRDTAPGAVVSGVVRRPNGARLGSALVTIIYPLDAQVRRARSIQIKNGEFAPVETVSTAVTDVQGRFSLMREPDPGGKSFSLVAIHPDFFGEIDRSTFDTSSTITVNRWGRVEGVATMRGVPVPGASIHYFADRIHDPAVPEIFDFGQATADDHGRFQLERVIPGDLRVSQVLRMGSRFTRRPGDAIVEVRPGETAHVEFREYGRPVVARVAPPAGFDLTADYTVFSEYSIESNRPRIPFPEAELARTGEPRMIWAKRWFASAEGREYRRKSYGAKATIRSDGTLRAENLTPGDYRLRLTYSAYPLQGIGVSPSRIAYATKRFTIPEIPGGRTDEPFDLGVIRPEPEQPLEVGQPAS
jgi:beta-lactamase regulating signal transducer with metallopeptidase domain/protocatechuate 3,4-dioxygenase beta subunit